MTKSLSDKQIQHLYWRAGFGITSKELASIRTFSKEKIIDQLFYESKQSTPLSMDLSMLEKNQKELTQEEKKQFRKVRNQKLYDLNILWIEQLINTKQVLREKIVLFFHNHFAVRLKNPRACLHLNNVVREHALGNFGDMLMEVSKSPAMLIFLNNRQNRKNSPNENFAREVMELFTLGRDNGYTEKDIKEAARAFTGWNFDKTGAFVFKKNQHDDGSKTVLGKTGNFRGEDIIKILLEEKQTARYITEKVYTHFVNDTPDTKHIEKLTDIFYTSNYSLEQLFKTLFSSDWFYKASNIGVKIKSPIELITGISRQFYVTYENPKVLLYLQRKLNQTLFYPPNVAGWPGGTYWIDNSTLMLRLKLASVTLNKGVIEWTDKGDMPEDTLMKMEFNKKMKSQIEKKVKATPDWQQFITLLEQKDKNALIEFLIQPQLSNGATTVIAQLGETNTKDLTIELLSLPEYQLC
ncbi:DUF1800 domain-containing protein [Aquimarina addita]|uniref:DUF1800 domain-containing protein n=1 Tax=Aquimarina addita TaxID=870485 RepID=A0ABP7XE62_9FLAO